MKELNLHLQSAGELILRTGTAPDVIEPETLSISGDIRSVGAFIKGRNELQNLQGINKETTIVTVDKEKDYIKLQANPNDSYGTTVTGTLLTSDELALFHINSTKTFSQKELIKILKFNRIYFTDNMQQQDLLKQYMAFTFKTNSEGHASGDDRGNKSSANVKAVETNIPKFFSLKIPIYKGERPVTFQVEICLDVTDGGGAKFWFESVELHELQQIEKEIIFKRELELCDGLVVIHK